MSLIKPDAAGASLGRAGGWLWGPDGMALGRALGMSLGMRLGTASGSA